LEVACTVADVSATAEIAVALTVLPGTVKTYVANLQAKLAVRSRIGIATWYLARL
jgi:DNA-binding NarL/FixJ family response regulator